MKNRNHSKKQDHGRNIALAFRYIQQIFKETSQLMKKLDSLMGKDWIPTYGNRTTKEVTSQLAYPESWLVQGSFRLYSSRKEPSIRKGITIAYWSDEIEEPILIAGKLNYILDETTGRPKAEDHWDLWYAWFEKDFEKKIIDGSVQKVKIEATPLRDYIREAKAFAIPLVSIQSETDIKTKLYDKLRDL